MFTWMRNLFTRKTNPLTGGRRSARRDFFPLRLERLEDRLAPVVTQVATAVAQYGTSSTLLNYAAPAATNGLLVVTAGDENGATNVSAVTFNGLSMTREVQATDGANSVDSIWYRVLGPSFAGATGNIVMTDNGSLGTRDFYISAAVFSGVNQTTPMSTGAPDINTSNGNDMVSVTSSPGDLVYDVYDSFQSTGGPPNATPGPGQTSIAQETGTIQGGGFDSANNSTKSGAAGTVSMSWTSTNSGAAWQAAVDVQQAASLPPVNGYQATAAHTQYTLLQSGGNLELVDTTSPSTILAQQPLSNSAITITGSNSSDVLTVDFSSFTAADPFPSGGLTWNAGASNNGTLDITGGSFGNITYNETDAQSGTIDNYSDAAGTMLLNSISYSGLAPLANTGTAADIVFNLPAGPNTATLADDAGGPGNGLSTLSSSPVTFESTTFANPTNSLTINRGSAFDTLTINAIPDLTAGLTVGSSAQPFATITVNSAPTLNTGAANLDLEAGAINLDATGTITTTNGQTYGGPVSLGASTSISGGAVTFTNSVDAAAAGTQALSISAPSTGVVTLSSIGQTTPLESLSVNTTGTIKLNGNIQTDTNVGSGNVTFGNGASVILGASVTIDTEQGNDGAGGNVSFINFTSAAVAGADLTIDTSTTNAGSSGGSVALGAFVNSGGFYLNDLSVITTPGAGGSPGNVNFNGSLIALDNNGANPGDFSIVGGGNIVLFGPVTIDTEQGNNGAGGSVNFGTSAVSASGTGVDLNINTATTAAGSTAGNVVLAAFNNAGGANIRNLSIDASATGSGATTYGNVTLSGGVTLAGSLTVASGGGSGANTFSAGAITTDTGNTGTFPDAIRAQNGVTLNGTLNAGASTVTIAANQDGSGSEGFTQASGTAVQTTNATANAIAVTVNTASGTGDAALGLLQSGGTVTVNANSGAITDNNGAASNASSPNLILQAAGGIGTALNPISLSGTTLTADSSAGNASQFLEASGSIGLNAGNALNAGTGTITLTGGTFQIQAGAGGNAIADASELTVNTPAILDLNGQNESVDGLSGTGTVTDVASPLSSTLTVGVSGGSGSFAGVISNGSATVALTKSGTGTETLTAASANTYTGATTVNGGTLLVNGSTAAGSAATISGTGVLGGTGTVGGSVAVNAGGTITGGTLGGVGTLTVGSLSFNGGTYAADFSGNTSDTIATASTVNLNAGTAGTFTINSQSPTATAGNVFTLIQNTGPLAISNPPLTGAAEGGGATIDNAPGVFSYAGGNGQSFTFTTSGAPTISLPAAGSYTLERVISGSVDDLELLQGNTVIDSQPTASVTGTYTINGTNGNVYTLTIDYTASGGYFQKDVSFNPGGTSGDALTIKGNATGGFGAIVFDYSTAHNGDVKNYSDLAATNLLNTITYTGLTPLTDSGSAGNVVYNLPAGPNIATLANSGGNLLLSSTPVTFEATTFANPTNSLTINAGSTADTLAITAPSNLTAGLTAGSLGTPFASITVSGTFTLSTGTAALALTASSISDTSGTQTAGSVNLTGTGTVAGNSIGININGATVQSSTGNIMLQGTGGNTGSDNDGVEIEGGGTAQATGATGTVTLQGTGGAASGNFNNGVFVSGGTVTSGGGNVSVTGQGQGTGSSNNDIGVWLQSSGEITSGGNGTVTVMGTGGATSGGTNLGVYVTASTVTSSGGNVSVTGVGQGTVSADNDVGVWLDTSSMVTSGGSGTVTVMGTGASTTNGSGNAGVHIANSSTITSGGGNVQVTGQGGGSGAGGTNNGIEVESAGTITAGGTATVTVMGTGAANDSGGDDFGVYVTGSSSQVTSTGGNVQVTGLGGGTGAGSFNVGVEVDTGGTITAGGSGTVTVMGTGGATTGGSDAGVEVTGSNATVTSVGGNVSVTGLGGGSGGSNAGVDVDTGGTITAGGAGTVTVMGTGGASAGGSDAGVVVINGSATITSNGGNVSVTGLGGGSGAGGANAGVDVERTGTITAGGTGTVTVMGTGGANDSGGSDIGVSLSGAGADVTSGGGNVSVTGQGGGTGGASANYGVAVGTGTTITAGGTGTVTVMGTGGATTGGSDIGVFVTGAGAQITSTGGNVSVTGQGGGSGSGGENTGVDVDSGGTVTAGGSGTVTVMGTGATSDTGGFDIGVLVQGSGALVTSTGGNVSVTGQGGGSGTSTSNVGIDLESGGEVTAGGGSSTVTVQGTGGPSSGGFNAGVQVLGTGATVTSGGGNVSVTGQGGGTGAGGSNYGIILDNGGTITAGGTATVTVMGTGGATAGGLDIGVFVTVAGAQITSTGGNVSVTGQAGGSATTVGIFVDAGTSVTAPGANSVTLTGTGANTGDITIGGTVSSTSGPVGATSSGLLSETGGGLISTTGTLTTSSATGTTLSGAGTNAVGTFNATNSTSGNISLDNTIATLIVSGLSEVTGGSVTINNTGADTFSNALSGGYNLNDTSTGLTTFSAAVGSPTPLASVSVTNAADINGGSVGTTGSQSYGGNVTLGAATILTHGGANSLTMSGATVSLGNFTLTDQSLSATDTGSIAAQITSTGGGLTEQGPGTLTLTGIDTYTGATTVTGGTLLVNGSTVAASAATVSGTGVLGGTGTVGGSVAVNSGGTITGGTLGTVGTLTVGSLSFNGGTYQADFNGNTSDTIAMAGTVNLAGPTQGIFNKNSQAGTATPGTVFTLISNTGPLPIQNPPLTGAPEGGADTIDGAAGFYTYAGGNGQSFTFTASGPATIALPQGGNYVLSRVVAGTVDDLQLREVSPTARIIDERPTASVTGTYTINGTNGNVYTLTVDYTNTGGYFQKDVSFNPGGTSGDTLTIKGNQAGGFGAIVFDYSTAHNGDVKNYSDLAATNLLNTITYTGLTPLTDLSLAGNAIFNLPAGPNIATLANSGASLLLSSTPVTFEMTTFANPTNSLTINAGSTADTLAIIAPSNLTAGLTAGSLGTPFASITVSGTFTLSTGTAALALTASSISDTSGTQTAGSVTLTGTGTVAGNAVGINISGATLQSSTGNLTLQGTGGNTGADNDGIFLHNGAIVQATGAGSVTFTGTGGPGTLTNFGVDIQDATTQVKTTTGALRITGTGGAGTAANSFDVGVIVQSAAVVAASGAGAVTVMGTGGAGTGADFGVDIAGTGTQVTSAGTVLITGTGGGTGAGSTEIGVDVFNNALVSGTGGVTIQGTGGTGTQLDRGVVVDGNNVGAQVTSAAALQITGTGGSGASNEQGVLIDRGGSVTATTATGTVSIAASSTAGNAPALSVDATSSISAAGTADDITLTSNNGAGVQGTVTTPGGLLLDGTAAGNFTLTNAANNVARLAATLSGNLSFSDSAGLTVGTVFATSGINAGAGTITLNVNQGGGAGNNFTQNVGANIVTTNNTAAAISLTVGGTGNANLTNLTTGTPNGQITISAGGSILNNGSTTGLTAGVLSLTAGGEIGQPGAGTLLTAASSLTASATDTSALANHGIWLSNTGALTVTSATTTNGVILIDATGGNLTATSVTAGGSKNVRLRTLTSGNIILGTVTASGAIVSLLSAGTITGGPAAVTALSLLMSATSIGTAGTPLSTVVSKLAATTTTGGLFVSNTGALTVTTVTAFGVTQTGLNSSGNNITLTATGLLTIGDGTAAENITAGTATVDITAAGVTETTAPTASLIAAGSLRLQGTGTFTLTSPNAVATLAANTTGAIVFLDGQALTVGAVNGTNGITSANSTVTLCVTVGDLTLANLINAGTAMALLDSFGNINQTAGIITANTLGVRANGNIVLPDLNAAKFVAFQAGGTFTYNSAGPFSFILSPPGLPASTCFRGANDTTGGGAGSDITICQNTGTLTVNVPLNAGANGTIRLQANGGGVTQTAAGNLTANRLGVLAAGAITLPDANNSVNFLAAQTTGAGGGAIHYANAIGFTVDTVTAALCFAGATGVQTVNNSNITLAAGGGGTITLNNVLNAGAGTVRLQAGGGVSQNATGVITAASLGVSATSGILLNGAVNVVGNFAASDTTSGAIEFQDNVATLTVGDQVTADAPLFPGAVTGVTGPADVTISNTGSLIIDQALTAGDTVRLTAGAAVSQLVTGVISGASLGVVAANGILLDTAANAVDNFTASNSIGGAGAIKLRDNVATLTLGNTITADAPCFPKAITGIVGPADITLSNTGNLEVDQAITTPATVRLNAGGAVSQLAGGGIIGASLGITAATGIGLDAALSFVGNFAAADSTSGAIRLLDSFVTLTLGDTVTADGLAFPSAVTGVTGPADVTVSTNAGNVVIDQALSTPATVRLTANGAVSQLASGVITAASLGVQAGTGIGLDTAVNAVGSFTAADVTSGAIKLLDSVATLTVGDTVTADAPGFPSAVTGVTGPADVTLSNTGNLTVDQAVSTPATVRLTASGAVSQLASGVIAAASLGVLAGTGIGLDTAVNAVGNFAATDVTSGPIKLRDSVATLTVGDTVTADALGFPAAITGVTGPANVTLSNTGNLTVDQAVTAGAANTVRLTAGGTVSQLATGVINTAGSLGVVAATGIGLNTAVNAVGNFTALDTTSGTIELQDSVTTLTVGDTVSADAPGFPNPITGVNGPADVTLSNTGNVVIDQGLGTPTTVRLNAGAAVSQLTTGIIIATNLGVTAAAGIGLATAVNAIGNFTAADSTSGTIELQDNVATLTVGDTVGADAPGFPNPITGVTGPADVTLGNIGGNLAIDQALTTPTTVRLTAGAAVSQLATGVVTAASLGVAAATGIGLDTAVNVVGNFTAADTPSGTVLLQDSVPTLTVGDTVTADVPAFPNALTGITAPSDVTLCNTGNLTIDQAVGAGPGTVRLTAGAVVSQFPTGTLAAANLGVVAPGPIALDQANNISGFVALNATAAGAPVSFNDSGSPTGFTIGTIAAGSCFGGATSIVTNGANVTVTAVGPVTFGDGNGQGISAPGASVDLNTGGAAENTGSIINAANLLLQGSGTFNLMQSNAIGMLSAATTGAINFSDSLALTVCTVLGTAGINTGGNNLTLFSNGLLTIGSGAGEAITATGATVNLNVAGATEANGSVIQAASLLLDGTGTFSLTQSNKVGTLAASIAGSLTFNNATPVTIGTVNGTSGINTTAAGSGGIAPPPPAKGSSTVGVFDPTNATWYLRNSNSQGAPDITPFAYGEPGWIGLTGDWNGDGQTTIGVFNPTTATWYLRNENSAGAPDFTAFQYGEPGWIPVVGDWDGNGTTTIGVVDPTTGTWYLRNENSAGAPDAGVFKYGAPGWIPVVGDWSGSGTSGIGVVDPTTETWYLRNEVSAGAPDAGKFAYGAPGWKPVVGDWNGAGKTTVAVVDPTTSTWYIRYSNSAGAPNVTPFAYGAPGVTPVAGDWLPPVAAKAANVLGAQAAANTTPNTATTVDLTAAGVTESGNSPIIAGNLLLQGNGTFVLTQGNQVTTLAAATSGGPVQFTDVGNLTVGSVSGTNGISTTNQPLALAASGNLTIAQGINTGTAPLTLTFGTDGAPDTLTVNGPITASAVTINGGNGGDKFVINVQITAPSGVTINGGSGPDQFIITPSSTAPITVNGGLPTTVPGNTLTLQLPSGTNVTQFEITSQVGEAKNGFFNFSNGVLTLTFTSIEMIGQVNITVASYQDAATDAQLTFRSNFNGTPISGNIPIPKQPQLAFFLSPNLVNPGTPFGAPTVAVGDVNGDGIGDVIIGAGPGSEPLITVLNGAALLRLANNQPTDPNTPLVLTQFLAFDPTFLGGVNVAAGNIVPDVNPTTGANDASIVVGVGPSAAPGPVLGSAVRTFEVSNPGAALPQMAVVAGPLGNFQAYPAGFNGGVRVAVGNIDGHSNGLADVITGPGAGFAPLVEVFDGVTGTLSKSFDAYAPSYMGGVSVAAGNYRNTATNSDDILVGPGSGAMPNVEIFEGDNLTLLADFQAFTPVPLVQAPSGTNPQFLTGVSSVAFAGLNAATQKLDILVGVGAGEIGADATGQRALGFQLAPPPAPFPGGVQIADAYFEQVPQFPQLLDGVFFGGVVTAPT